MKKINLLPKTFQLLESMGLPACSERCCRLAVTVHLAAQEDQLWDPAALYPTAAALCRTSPASLEQSIRAAAEDCWERGRPLLEEAAQAPLTGRPEPSQLIRILVLHLSRQ